MLSLLIPTLLTSIADSFNPVAITQQFVLQGMVKKPQHIWFFIIPTGVVNLAGGFLAYFGFLGFAQSLLSTVMERYGQLLFTLELVLGIALLICVCYILQGYRIEALAQQVRALQGDADAQEDEARLARSIKSVSPPALIALGAGATIAELTTALPYFAFLAILLTHSLSIVEVSVVLVLYNFIYTLPLMILYFIYRRAQDRFDWLYALIKKHMTKWANILAPTLTGLVGIFLIVHSVSALLR